MKRTMGGGSHRGPVAIVRQRRTIRFVQFSLILLAAAALMLAGYSWGRARGFEQGRTASRIGAAPPASATETVVLAILGLGAFAGSMLLQDRGGVRLPVPARLEELSGRAESTAFERAEQAPEDRG